MRASVKAAHTLALTSLLRVLARRGGESIPVQRFWRANDEDAGQLLADAMWALPEGDRRWAARIVERLYAAVRSNPDAVWPWLD